MDKDENNNGNGRRTGKPLDYSKKAGGKIKRLPIENTDAKKDLNIDQNQSVEDNPDGFAVYNKTDDSKELHSKTGKKLADYAVKKPVHELEFDDTEKKPRKTKNPITKKDLDNYKNNPQKEVKSDKADTVKKTDEKKKADSKTKPKKPVSKGLSVIEGGKSRKNIIKRCIIGGICAALAITFVLLCVLTPTGIGEWMKTKMSLSAGAKGYPVTFSGVGAKNIYSTDGQLILLTDTDIRCYNKNGSLIFTRIHGFATPIVKTSKIRTLSFDRGGYQYRIDTPSDVIKTDKCENKIISGAIADNGYYVLATCSDTETSLVTVYDANGNEKYKYRSSKYYVTSVAISDDGSKICVCSVNADEAVLSSEIMLFSISSKDKQFSKVLTGDTVYSVNFCGSTVCGITDNRWFSVNSGNEYKEQLYGSNTIVKYDFMSNGKTLLVLSSTQNSSKNTICLINLDSTFNTRFDVDTTVSSVCASDSNIYILSSTLQSYSYSGEKMKEDTLDAGAVSICSSFGKSVVLYSSSIKTY